MRLASSSFVLLLSSVLFFSAPTPQTANLPAQLTDAEFWRIFTEFSEPGGTYPYENFVTNEETIQDVMPVLTKVTKPGGVYLGVGPEQNFTYIAGVKPKMAFIFDIRRQNAIEHLMYQNAAALPVDSTSLYIRFVGAVQAQNLKWWRGSWLQAVSPMIDLRERVNAGGKPTYAQVLQMIPDPKTLAQ